MQPQQGSQQNGPKKRRRKHNRIVAQANGFSITLLEQQNTVGWNAYVLRGPRRKYPNGRWMRRKWWFGHNGERISRNNHMGHLAEHHPTILAWIEETLMEK